VSWKCPTCGPVDAPMFGEDEQFHCSKVGCDEVVSILSEAERIAAQGWKKFSIGPGPRRNHAKEEQDSRTATAEGKRILANMAARNEARSRGTTIVKKTKKKAGVKDQKKSAAAKKKPDATSAEVAAIETCLRALEGLDAAESVIRYVARRHGLSVLAVGQNATSTRAL